MQVDSNPTEVTTEMEASNLVEVANDVDTQSTEQPTAEVSTPATEPVAQETVVDPTAPVVPAYTPDFKIKVKGKEYEIDEMFRGLIKTPEDEKKVKELFEKSYGLDSVKQDRKALKDEYEGFKSQIMPHIQLLDQFTSLRDKGNLGAALQVAGITDEMVFEYAVRKLEMDQNPMLAQTYKQQQEQSIRELEMSRKLAQYEQKDAMTAEQQFHSDLEASIAGVQDVAAQVNAKFGSEDAFKDEVIAHGLAQLQRGIQLTPAQATEYVANKYKQLFPQQSSQPAMPQSAPQQAAPVAPQGQQIPVHQRPATMPNVGGSNSSPIKRKISSIDDLKAAAREAV